MKYFKLDTILKRITFLVLIGVFVYFNLEFYEKFTYESYSEKLEYEEDQRRTKELNEAVKSEGFESYEDWSHNYIETRKPRCLNLENKSECIYNITVQTWRHKLFKDIKPIKYPSTEDWLTSHLPVAFLVYLLNVLAMLISFVFISSFIPWLVRWVIWGKR